MRDDLAVTLTIWVLVCGAVLTYWAWAASRCHEGEELIDVRNFNAMCRDKSGVVYAR